MKILLAVVAFLLAGCGPTQQAKSTIAKRYIVGAGTVYEFNLEDGTRCVTHVQRGGIDCEWKTP